MGCAAACEPAEQGKAARYCGYVEPGKRFRVAAVMWSLGSGFEVLRRCGAWKRGFCKFKK